MIKNSIQSWDGHSRKEIEEYIKRRLESAASEVAERFNELLKDAPQSLDTLKEIADKIDTLYTKPETGIPATDLAEGVIPTISTDITTDGDSDTKTASPKAVKTYVDESIPAALSAIESEIETIGRGEYVTAWDGASTPVVADIPAGVSVTYNTTSYTGELAASDSTMGKIYLVSTGTTDEYDRYVTVRSGSVDSYTYSWSSIGSTSIQLSDYATKAEVSQLGQEVGNIDYDDSSASFTLSDGYVSYQSGNEDTSTINKKSTAIQVSGVKRVKYTATTVTSENSSVGAAFYDANGVFILGIRNSVASQVQLKEYESAVPINAATFKFTINKDYAASAEVSLISGDTIAGHIETVDKKFSGLTKNYTKGYLYQNQGILSSDDYIVTDYIPVEPGDTIVWYNGLGQNQSVYLCFYEKSGVIAGGAYYSANSVPSRTFEIPSSAIYAYCRATVSAINPDVYISRNGVKVWERKEGVVGVYDYPLHKLGKEKTIFSVGSYLDWVPGYVSNYGGVWTNSSVNSVTRFIRIDGFKKVRLLQSITTNASNASVCFYDKNGTFIKAYTAQVDSVKSYQERTLDVPDNAVYIRASLYNEQTQYWFLVGIIPDELPHFVPMIGSPILHFSSETAESAQSLNSKTAAELYAEYDSLVTSYPKYLKRDTDIGEVTYNGSTYAIRAYTFGYNNQVLIDHEPSSSEIVPGNYNKWEDELNPRKILLVSGMHGDEHTPCWGLMLAITEILESEENWAHYIKDNFIFKILPCVNPAGWTAMTRTDSQGHAMNRDEAIDDPESTYYMGWVNENKDAFILIDCHGTQGHYAYFPVMTQLPMARMIYTFTNKLGAALYKNWSLFYDGISSGYGTTYAPFLVAKYTPKSSWTRGRYACRMYEDYGMQQFAIETPDDLISGSVANNDLRNCKLTKDMVINALQFICGLPNLPK